MIENEFYLKLKFRLELGESSLSLKQFMMPNFKYWEEIDVFEIEEILDLINTNQLSIYAFLTFWHNLIGVDLFELYSRRNNEKWQNDTCYEIIDTFETYPRVILMSDINLLAENKLSLFSFWEIRRRLTKQGLNKVHDVPFRFLS